MCRIIGVLTIVLMAYWASAFTIEADFPIADSPNIYVDKPDCVSFSDNIFVKIAGCTACGNCPLKKGQNVSIDAGFTPRTSINEIRLHYDIFLFGINVKNGDKNVTLPANAGQAVSFHRDILLSDSVPTGSYELSLRVFKSGETSNPLICINKCGVTVVNP